METVIAIALITGNLLAIVAHLNASAIRYVHSARDIYLSVAGMAFAIFSMFFLAAFGASSEILGFVVAFSAFIGMLSFLLGPMSAGSES